MHLLLHLALKDLRLLTRRKSDLFFTLVWPLIAAVFFGSVMFGGSSSATVRIAVVDEDGTGPSRDLVGKLSTTKGLDVELATRAQAEEMVRRGRRAAFVAVPSGFGAASDRMFYGDPPSLEIGLDPSRQAESAMLEGLVTGAAMERMQTIFTKPAAGRDAVAKALLDLGPAGDTAGEGGRVREFLGDLDRFLVAQQETGAGEAAPPGGGWRPLRIAKRDIVRERKGGPPSAYAVTIPQGMLWGIVGCAASFGIGLVLERNAGTLTRLQMSPMPRGQILLGKALACFLAILFVETMLLAIGRVVFDVRPTSVFLLAIAVVSAALAFVGVMMLVSTLGRSEQSSSGAGWAVLLVMSAVGGAMIPLFVMPPWLLTLSHLSPVKWAILAIEGALWRGFTPREMVVPCAILLAVGAAGLGLGARVFRTAE